MAIVAWHTAPAHEDDLALCGLEERASGVCSP